MPESHSITFFTDGRAPRPSELSIPKAMQDSKLRFSDRVENYVKYRPHYPQKIVHDLVTLGVISEQATIADVGSGTGHSTVLFLSHRYTCFGVEPNHEMRAAAETLLEGHPQFMSRNGSAEATGLSSQSVDLIIAGQAFHWFDQTAAKQEFLRILKPGGYVALIWNEREHTGSEFQKAYEALLLEHCPDYGKVNHRNVDTKALERFFSPSVYSIREYENSQQFDLPGFKGRSLSSSYCPNPGEPNHDPLMEALTRLFHKEQSDGYVSFDYCTRVYLGQLQHPHS